MKEKPRKEEHYGAVVHVNPIIESLRKEECLCLNCGGLEKCNAAKKFFEVCKEEDIALAVTRCRSWKDKE